MLLTLCLYVYIYFRSGNYFSNMYYPEMLSINLDISIVVIFAFENPLRELKGTLHYCIFCQLETQDYSSHDRVYLI